MPRLEHPRAARGETPPDRVGYGTRKHAAVDEDGYFEVPEKYAETVRNSLAQKYGVEYDSGDVVLPDETESGSAGEETPEGDSEAQPESGTSDDFDLESYLGEQYTDRADAVASGEVDAHLDAIEEAETSETVKDAIAERRAELESED